MVEANGDGFGLSATCMSTKVLAWVRLCEVLTVLTVRSGTNGLYASGQNAEVWAAGLKYDAINIYLAFPTRNAEYDHIPVPSTVLLTKLRTLKLLLSTRFDFGLRPSIAYLKSR